MSAASRIAEADRRRALLAALAVAPGRALPYLKLRQAVERVGYEVSMDRLRTDLAWLAEQDLIALPPGGAELATLTERGEDVVMMRASVPGVGG